MLAATRCGALTVLGGMPSGWYGTLPDRVAILPVGARVSGPTILASCGPAGNGFKRGPAPVPATLWPMSRLKSRALAVVLVGLAALAFLLRAELAFLIANQRPDVEGARLAVKLGIRGHEVVAEIGAGSGHHTVAIARRLPRGRMYSTELDDNSLQDIRHAVADAGLSNVEVRQAEVHATGLPDACCDAVFMRTVYHHFLDPPLMLESLHATLKPSGLLAIIELEPRGLWHLIGSPRDTPDRGGHGIPKNALVQEVTGSRRFSLERVVEDWVGPLYLAVFRRSV